MAELREWGFDSPLYNHSLKALERAEYSADRARDGHPPAQGAGQGGGASGFSLDRNEILNLAANTVILCTGAGGFKLNGFPVWT